MPSKIIICRACEEAVVVDPGLGVATMIEPGYAREPGRATIIEGGLVVHQCLPDTYGHLPAQ